MYNNTCALPKRVLFYGDSITDAGRDRNDPQSLGEGFVRYAVQFFRGCHPDSDCVFLNRGISGNRTEQMVARLQTDLVALCPDTVVLLAGINDVWHRARENEPVDYAAVAQNLKTMLDAIRGVGARVILLEPFVVAPSECENLLREGVNRLITLERALAQSDADVYVPLDGLLAAESLKIAPQLLSADGVHPDTAGRKFIGTIVGKILAEMQNA